MYPHNEWVKVYEYERALTVQWTGSVDISNSANTVASLYTKNKWYRRG